MNDLRARLGPIGRIFYGIAIAATGLLMIYYRDFPYYLIPPGHAWISDHAALVYLAGAFLFLTGASILLGKQLLPVGVLLGTVLFLVFCFYFIPYEILVSPNHMHFGDWENAAKVLALAGGAFIIADSGVVRDQRPLSGIRGKLIRLGTALFPLAILSFGVDHFLYAKEAGDYIPSWIADHLFWMYLTGSALLASSIAILLRIKPRSAAGLLGGMIFIWVIILHIPKCLAAPFAVNGGEIVSGLLALAYCGTAWVIAGGC